MRKSGRKRKNKKAQAAAQAQASEPEPSKPNGVNHHESHQPHHLTADLDLDLDIDEGVDLDKENTCENVGHVDPKGSKPGAGDEVKKTDPSTSKSNKEEITLAKDTGNENETEGAAFIDNDERASSEMLQNTEAGKTEGKNFPSDSNDSKTETGEVSLEENIGQDNAMESSRSHENVTIDTNERGMGESMSLDVIDSGKGESNESLDLMLEDSIDDGVFSAGSNLVDQGRDSSLEEIESADEQFVCDENTDTEKNEESPVGESSVDKIDAENATEEKLKESKEIEPKLETNLDDTPDDDLYIDESKDADSSTSLDTQKQQKQPLALERSEGRTHSDGSSVDDPALRVFPKSITELMAETRRQPTANGEKEKSGKKKGNGKKKENKKNKSSGLTDENNENSSGEMEGCDEIMKTENSGNIKESNKSLDIDVSFNKVDGDKSRGDSHGGCKSYDKDNGKDNTKEECNESKKEEEACGGITKEYTDAESDRSIGGSLDAMAVIPEGPLKVLDTNTSSTEESSSDSMTHEALQSQLREQHEAMTRMQSHAHAQQVTSNLLVTSLRTKLRRKDQELQMVRAQSEKQISAVISHLLYLEGQMQKEHKEIFEILQEKDDVIRRQKAAIADLSAKNEKLLTALQESQGYRSENGMVKPVGGQVVTQNGNYSIQDHGNKVILRGNKGRNGEKAPPSGHKVRFGSVKDKLRRHKSSLELYHSEPLETLFEGTHRYYGSEENLVDEKGSSEDVRRSGGREGMHERCRSLVVYPTQLREEDEVRPHESPDSCFEEFHSDLSHTDSRSSSTSSLVNGFGSPGSAVHYGFNELSKSRSVPHALPTVTESDVTSLKERPHSLPSVDFLASETSGSKVNMSPSLSPTQSSPPSESNPFKSFKNVFKRRGSKKKRSVSLGQDTNKEYHDAVKQHFKKYDLT